MKRGEAFWWVDNSQDYRHLVDIPSKPEPAESSSQRNGSSSSVVRPPVSEAASTDQMPASADSNATLEQIMQRLEMEAQPAPARASSTQESAVVNDVPESKAPAVINRVVTPRISEPAALTAYQAVEHFQFPVRDPKTKALKHLVGNEALAYLSTLCFVKGVNFGILGYSGTGKTFAADRWMELPEESDYIVLSQLTARALHAMEDQFEGKSWMHFTEIQKAFANRGSKGITEIIKELGEGKPARLDYVKSGGKHASFTIPPLNICFTLATQNDYELDAEMSRRFVLFETDNSIEQQNRINEQTSQNMFRVAAVPEEDRAANDQYKGDVRNIARHDFEYLDPFNEAFMEMMDGIPHSGSLVPLYHELVRASAKYHSGERERVSIGDKEHLFIGLEDHVLVHDAYFQDFLGNCEAFGKTTKHAEGLEEEFGRLRERSIDWSGYFSSAVRTFREHPDRDVLERSSPGILDRWVDRQVSDGDLVVGMYDSNALQQVGVYDGS